MSLKDIYYNPSTGFVGIQKLFQKAKEAGLNVKREDVRNFLKEEDVYQQFMPHENQNSYVAQRPLDEFQVDIIYMQDLAKTDFAYVLTCIDVCSRIGDAEPIKTKGATDTLEAFKKIISRMGKPKQIYSDDGKEWKGEFGKYLEDEKIKHIAVLTHAPFVERFNQTLKNMLFRIMTEKGYSKWREILPDVINNYNNSYHRIIKMTPNEAKENVEKAVENTLLNAKFNQRDKIDVGDNVRVVKKENAFTKSYLPRYENKQYVVEKIDDGFYYLNGKDDPLIRSNIRKFKPIKELTVRVEPDEDIEYDVLPSQGEELAKSMRIKKSLKNQSIQAENILPPRRGIRFM